MLTDLLLDYYKKHTAHDLKKYIHSPAFLEECELAHEMIEKRRAEEEQARLQPTQDELDAISNASKLERGPYDVSKLEAIRYYAGLGRNGRGPILIYRTSPDVFDIGGAYKRRMSVMPVPGNFYFGPKEANWDMIRDKVRQFLDFSP